MHRILPLLLVTLIAAVSVFSQTKNNQAISSQIKTLRAEKYLALDYNKSAGVTKILGFGEDFGREQDKLNGLSALSFGITFNYAGEQLSNEPETFMMTFWAKANKPKFAQSHSLKVVTSTETLDLGEARYATKPSERNMEFLNFVVSRENLSKIANGGDNVRMMLGDTEFKFTTEHIRLFKNLLEISNLL